MTSFLVYACLTSQVPSHPSRWRVCAGGCDCRLPAQSSRPSLQRSLAVLPPHLGHQGELRVSSQGCFLLASGSETGASARCGTPLPGCCFCCFSCLPVRPASPPPPHGQVPRLIPPLWVVPRGFLSFFLCLFLERGEGKREREGNINVWLPLHPLTGDLACSPGTCPHWQSNWHPSGWQAGAQSTEPLQPGRVSFLWDGPLIAILPHAGAQQGECVHMPACRAPTKHGCSPGWLFDGLAPALRLPVPSQSRRGLSSVS